MAALPTHHGGFLQAQQLAHQAGVAPRGAVHAYLHHEHAAAAASACRTAGGGALLDNRLQGGGSQAAGAVDCLGAALGRYCLSRH